LTNLCTLPCCWQKQGLFFFFFKTLTQVNQEKVSSKGVGCQRQLLTNTFVKTLRHGTSPNQNGLKEKCLLVFFQFQIIPSPFIEQVLAIVSPFVFA
jgi:hypothetical protein